MLRIFISSCVYSIGFCILCMGFVSSTMEPLLNSVDEGATNSDDMPKDKNVVGKVHGMAPQVVNGLSLQGYMSSFYRSTTIYSFTVEIIYTESCIRGRERKSLVHFKVKTRPEKLWVGPGSKAADEKLFFDSHRQPFYRIEQANACYLYLPQLILATLPDPKHGKAPSIVAEDNILLLFEIQKKVDGIRANYSGLMVSLADIYLKPLGEACATQSVLQYFKMDPENFDYYGGVQHAEYCFQILLSLFGPLPRQVVIEKQKEDEPSALVLS